MRAQLEVEPDGRHIAAALAGLVATNEELMRTGEFPPLYRSGVRYTREAPRRERWQNVEQLMRSRRADCEDLASARTAELRVSGEDPEARAIAYRSKRNVWHCVVRRGNGTIEDPSRVLGMGGGNMQGLGYSVRREGDGYRATVRLRRHDGRTIGFSLFRRIARGVSNFAKKVAKSKLLRGAIKLARKALSSPFLQALLPPQVALALRAASALAKAAKKGSQMFKIAQQLQRGGLSQLATLATQVATPR
jgi:hypothetical protein